MDTRRRIFESGYQMEMHNPVAKHRWHFALPILYSDRLAGKLDARRTRRPIAVRCRSHLRPE